MLLHPLLQEDNYGLVFGVVQHIGQRSDDFMLDNVWCNLDDLPKSQSEISIIKAEHSIYSPYLLQ
jgi:hypothetical protein